MSGHPDSGVQGDVFSRLRWGMKELSPQQKSVCEYILEHHQQVAFYTVEELACASGASPATIVRLVKNLEYGNYKLFLDALQQVLIMANSSVWWELEKMWTNGQKAEDSLSWIAKDSVESIQNSLTPSLLENFNAAVNMMDKARKIAIIGMRSSKYIAFLFHYLLNQILSNLVMPVHHGADTMYDELIDLGEHDVVVIISQGGPHFVASTLEAMKFMKESGIPRILITNNMANPSVEISDVTLCVGQAKEHYSLVPVLTVLEAMVVELGRRKRETGQKKLHRLEHVLDSMGITMP